MSELRTTRNKSAHDETFSIEDTYRVFDSITRLLTAISAPEVSEVEQIKQELMKTLLSKQIGENAHPNTPIQLPSDLPTQLNKSESKCLKHIQTNTFRLNSCFREVEARESYC